MCIIIDGSRRTPLHQSVEEELEVQRLKRIAEQIKKQGDVDTQQEEPIKPIVLSNPGLAIPRTPPNTLYLSSQKPNAFTNDQVTEVSAFTKALQKFILYPGIYLDTASDVSADHHKLSVDDDMYFSSSDDEDDEVNEAYDETFMTAVKEQVINSPSKSNHREKFGSCRLGSYVS
eukprot:CAMPEP_0117426194 /NCGR_PEP_ID=MMETSP0758-20121206/6349_1 /TAXON_ID=63605 /ORGANISM="Percolomonas cosmopolitus, Strain AE-1 (ATCC 50343)" /LENGTH=173 /DNA_ID=CAMNT_0005211201 /DNA_START=384 /DNA_END=901 /DNA_ORIENTATION=-